MGREFELHKAYAGRDGFYYTIERVRYFGFAVVAWKFDNGLFDRDYNGYYQRFSKYEYAEDCLRGKGCRGNV